MSAGLVQAALSECARIERAFVGGRQRHNPGHPFGINRFGQRLINSSRSRPGIQRRPGACYPLRDPPRLPSFRLLDV